MTTSTDKFDAVIIGAGFSGLYMLHRLRQLGPARAGCTRPATASAARGTGTATRAPGATRRATSTATRSPRSCCRSGTGPSGSRRRTRSCATSTSSPTGSTCAPTSSSRRGWSPPSTTTRPSGGMSTTDAGDRGRSALRRDRRRLDLGRQRPRHPRARHVRRTLVPHRPVAARRCRSDRASGSA